jgi:hypothetical protein
LNRRALALLVALAGFLASAGGAAAQGGWLLARPPDDCTLITGLAIIQVMRPASVPSRCSGSRGDPDKARAAMARLSARPVYRTLVEIFFDEWAPEARWKQMSAFDNARDCEAMRAKLRAPNPAMDQLLDRNLGADAFDDEFSEAYGYVAMQLSRCVPASVVFPPAR